MSQQAMQQHHQKIAKTAKRLRIAIWLFSAFLLTVFIAGFFIEQPTVSVKRDYGSEQLISALAEKSLFPEKLYGALDTLYLLLVGVFLFWLQRLLGYFQRAEYFSNHSIRCYLWMVWIFVTLLLVPVLQKLYLHYLSYRYLPDLDLPMVFEFNFSSLVLLILLPMIIYLLRIAQSLESENQEFV